MRTHPVLSVIIPLYNAEPYVRRALESVFATDISSDFFEVIVVNDGSTDGSMAVVRGFADRCNLIVFEQENSGPGGARMTGVSLAHGDYVWFVDADDFLLADAMDKVMGLLEEKQDASVLMFPLIRSSFDLQEGRLDYCVEGDREMEGKEIVRNPDFPVWTPTRFILKRSLMENPWIYFPKKLIHEDDYFGVVLLCLSERVWVIKDPVYFHPSCPGSIMNTLSHHSFYDMVSIHRLQMRFMREVLDPSDWTWFHEYTFGSLMFSYDRFPRSGVRRKGTYLWRAWKRIHPGKSLKNQLGRWFYFVLPGVYDRYLQFVRK